MTQVGQAEFVTSASTPSAAWIARTVGVFAVVLALLSALTTFMVLAGLTPIAPTHQVVVTLLLVNAVTVALLVGLIGREMWRVIQARRRGRAAARLHVRIVALFSVIAAAPAILVAVVASVTLDRGLDRLFSQQTHSMIENSLIVADAYVREHAQFARADAIATAIELARAKPLYDQSRDQFRKFLAVQASIRGLPAVMLLDKDLNVIEQVDSQVSNIFSKPSPDVLASVNDTEPQVAMFLDANYVAAIIKLRGYTDTYLYIARLLDPRVLAQLNATREGVAQYADLESRRVGVQIAFGLMYTVISLIVLLSAVWIGLELRELPRRAHSPPHRRRPSRRDRQSLRSGADPAVGGRSRPAWRDLQQDDAGIAHAARRYRPRARSDRQPPPVHRSRAGERECRRDRRRRREPDQHPQPLGRTADWLHRDRGARPAAH